MIAVNIMTAKASLGPDATVSDALELIGSAAAAAVVGPGGRVLGLVTPGDILALISGRGADLAAVAAVPLREAMSESFATVTPEADFFALRRVLDSPEARGVVAVVDDGKRFLGLITHKDMLRRVWEYTEKRRAGKG